MITTTQKTDISYKRLSGKSTTDKESLKQDFLEPNSPMVVDASNILMQRLSLPSKPLVYTNGQKFDINGNLTVDDDIAVLKYVEEVMSVVLDSPESWTSTIKNIIPYYLNSGVYAPNYFDQTSTQIPFGSSGMYFDNDSGILTFFEGTPENTTSITIKCWQYVGKTLDTTTLGGTTITTTTFNVTSETIPVSTSWSSTTKKFTITHNFGNLNYMLELYETNDYNILQATTYKGINTLTVQLSFTPLDIDNIVVKLIKY